MIKRISRGLGLVGSSWRILNSDKELLLLPSMSFVAMLAVGGAIVGGAHAAGAFEEGGPQALIYMTLFAVYFRSTFLGVFFNAAGVAAAMQRLEGGDPTVGSGLRAAWGKVGKILVWALVGATVGVILRAIESKADWVGDIVVRILGVAWGVVTFFVVPVLLFEPRDVGGAIKRSSGIVKERWGEKVTGNVSIQLALFVSALPVLLVVGLLAALDDPGDPRWSARVRCAFRSRHGPHGHLQHRSLSLCHDGRGRRGLLA